MAKTSKKAAKKKTTKKSSSRKRRPRGTYSDALKKRVAKAVKKGMTHLEASKAFDVGIHSIPNWIRKHL